MTEKPLPPSLWAATAATAPACPPLRGEATADVVVVGGGYCGLSAALHLAEAGASVALIEAAEPGWGASGRNGGQVIPGLKYDPDELSAMFGPEQGSRLAALAGGAADLVFDLAARHGIDCAADRTGWIQAANSSTALDTCRRRVEQWARRGAPVELLDRARIADELGTDTYLGGWLDRRGGQLQPLSYARGLARAAITKGARLHGRSPALKLERRGKAWRLETHGGVVAADTVLLCTNGYTDGLWPGLKRTLIPVQSFQVATAPIGANLAARILPGGKPVSDTRRLLRYFRWSPDGRLIMGGRGTPRGEHDRRRYGGLEQSLVRLFPDLGAPRFDFHWSGTVALTIDHVPHIHEPEPGLRVGLGFNGRGVAMASLMGKLLAERTLGAASASLGLPITAIAPLPLWSLRQPVLTLMSAYYRWRDGLDEARGSARRNRQ